MQGNEESVFFDARSAVDSLQNSLLSDFDAQETDATRLFAAQHLDETVAASVYSAAHPGRCVSLQWKLVMPTCSISISHANVLEAPIITLKLSGLTSCLKVRL